MSISDVSVLCLSDPVILFPCYQFIIEKWLTKDFYLFICLFMYFLVQLCVKQSFIVGTKRFFLKMV